MHQGRSSDSSRLLRLPSFRQWQRLQQAKLQDGVEIHSNRYCSGFTPVFPFHLSAGNAALRLLVRCKCMCYFSHNQTFYEINLEWPVMMGLSAERRFRTDALCHAKLFSPNIFHNSQLFVNIVPRLRCPVSTTSLPDEKGTPV